MSWIVYDLDWLPEFLPIFFSIIALILYFLQRHQFTIVIEKLSKTLTKNFCEAIVAAVNAQTSVGKHGKVVYGDDKIMATHERSIIERVGITETVSTKVTHIVKNNSIIIKLDKSSYGAGETIVITGEVREFYSGTPVSVIVKAPNGNLVSIAQIDVGADKKFSTEMTAGGALMKSEGAYIVTVQYGTVNRSATTSFNLSYEILPI